MRQPFIAGNWKMNKTLAETVDLIDNLKQKVEGVDDVEIAVCPPAVNLLRALQLTEDSNIKVGAQDMHWEESGAYTGEISGSMLEEIGIDYVIIGHSERRQYFAETDQRVNRKVKAAFSHNIKPIICVGESMEERKAGKTEKKVKSQITTALAGLETDQVSQLVIAYEPLWAIGSGESASSEEANRVISYIREVIADIYPGTAEKVRIQYGGSVKPHNIAEFMQESDIDGALVGGASLDAESFAGVIKGF